MHRRSCSASKHIVTLMKQLFVCTAAALSLVVIAPVSGVASAEPSSATALATTPPPPAGGSITDLAVWRASYVNESDAMPIGATDKAMEYGVRGSFSVGAGGTVRGWMRWEEFAPTVMPQGTVRSFTQLVEVDCQGGRGRLLALDLYPYNNLQGAPRHVDAQDPQWTYARPGTVLEQNIGLMCSAAKSAVSAAVMQAQASGSLPASGLTTIASVR